LLLCAVATAAWTWHLAMNPATLPLDYLLLVVWFDWRIDFRADHEPFKKTWAPVTAADLRAAGRVWCWRISATLEQRYPGIAIESGVPDVWDDVRAVAGVPVGDDQGDAEIPAGRDCGDGRDFPVSTMVEILLGFFGHSLHCGEWVGLAGDRDQPGDRVRGGSESGCWTSISSKAVWLRAAPKYMEWYGAVWVDGHAGVAVSGDACG